jgi:hypothetical protein
VQFQYIRRQFFEKAAKWLNDARLVALAVGVHPRFAVVAAEVFEKSKGLAREDGCWLRHVGLDPCFFEGGTAIHSLHHSEAASNPERPDWRLQGRTYNG